MSLADRIPNNVDLADDPRLMRALTRWQPAFLDWWHSVGPDGFDAHRVWLRTAVSVHKSGWAQYAYVRMPEYRWGIFLTPLDHDTRIGFGDRYGEPAWREVPGELRGALRRIVVTQADTEPASVEQQRRLGRTAPSIYDLRNLFQVNVEEARHLWAMVHLLHRYFGRDGREEAERLLARRSGDPDRPRILETFNERTDDWLSFFMFATFTDRDGKFQLSALSESGFEPLARTTRFMLTEEAFHLFAGETGVERVVRRTAGLMRAHGEDRVRDRGGIDLPTIQRYLNFWFASSLDLFGSEDSTNAADWFASGLKGRHREGRYRDHRALDDTYRLRSFEDGRWTVREIPMRRALNAVLQGEYITDCERVLSRWNRTLAQAGLSDRLRLPDVRFHRHVGTYAGHPFSPEGQALTPAQFEARRAEWLPTAQDRAFVASVMTPVTEPGAYASWIAPPLKGVRDKPHDFPFVVAP